MYLLPDLSFASFGYKEPNIPKIINKWQKLSKKVEPTKHTRHTILNMMSYSPNEVTILKKTYKDGNKTRKVATGLMEAYDSPRTGNLVVHGLVGNPKSVVDPRFKGALDSVDKIRGKRKISIAGVNDDLEKLYDKKFGSNRV